MNQKSATLFSKKQYESKGMSRKYEHLSHKELVNLLGDNPEDNELFNEFYFRYHAHICQAVLKKFARARLLRPLEPDDIVQEVYNNLLKNNARALKQFSSNYENAVWRWLKVISYFTLLSFTENRFWLDIPSIPDRVLKKMVFATETQGEIAEEVKHCLSEIAAGRRHGRRDIAIFMLKAEGLSVEEISEYFDDISVKRTAGVVTEIRQALQERLIDRGINPGGKR